MASRYRLRIQRAAHWAVTVTAIWCTQLPTSAHANTSKRGEASGSLFLLRLRLEDRYNERTRSQQQRKALQQASAILSKEKARLSQHGDRDFTSLARELANALASCPEQQDQPTCLRVPIKAIDDALTESFIAETLHDSLAHTGATTLLPELLQGLHSLRNPKTKDQLFLPSAVPLFYPRLDQRKLQEQLDKIHADAKNVSAETLNARWSRQVSKSQESLAQAMRLIEQEISAIESSMKQQEEQMDELTNQLDQKKPAIETTKLLVIAMMVFLLLMFLVTIGARMYVSKPSSGSTIVSDRTLIEFGGMSFVLLTIIILANRNSLDREALAALLGTLAGYIFGKGFSGSFQDKRADVSTHALASGPPLRPRAKNAQPAAKRAARTTADRRRAPRSGVRPPTAEPMDRETPAVPG